MTDAPAPRRLAELYRAAMAQSPAVDSQALAAALESQGSREQRDSVLSQAAAHPAQAALLRTLTDLQADAAQLEREARALRRSRLQRLPTWAAVAACLSLAAVLALGFGRGDGLDAAHDGAIDPAVAARAIDSSERISSISFEGPVPAEAPRPLFTDAFDS